MREQNIDELLTWRRCHQPWLAAVFACIGNHGTAAFFGDTNGIVYAVKIDDGSLLWKVHADPHPAARITGSGC